MAEAYNPLPEDAEYLEYPNPSVSGHSLFSPEDEDGEFVDAVSEDYGFHVTTPSNITYLLQEIFAGSEGDLIESNQVIHAVSEALNISHNQAALRVHREIEMGRLEYERDAFGGETGYLVFYNPEA